MSATSSSSCPTSLFLAIPDGETVLKVSGYSSTVVPKKRLSGSHFLLGTSPSPGYIVPSRGAPSPPPSTTKPPLLPFIFGFMHRQRFRPFNTPLVRAFRDHPLFFFLGGGEVPFWRLSLAPYLPLIESDERPAGRTVLKRVFLPLSFSYHLPIGSFFRRTATRGFDSYAFFSFAPAKPGPPRWLEHISLPEPPCPPGPRAINLFSLSTDRERSFFSNLSLYTSPGRGTCRFRL